MCGERIVTTGRTTGLLTSEPGHPLYRSNHRHFHEERYATWGERLDVEKALEEAAEAGLWAGPGTVKLML